MASRAAAESRALRVGTQPRGVSAASRSASHPTFARTERVMRECHICGAPADRDFRAEGIGWLCAYCTRPDDEDEDS